LSNRFRRDLIIHDTANFRFGVASGLSTSSPDASAIKPISVIAGCGSEWLRRVERKFAGHVVDDKVPPVRGLAQLRGHGNC
jgi:hypothetical protein